MDYTTLCEATVVDKAGRRTTLSLVEAQDDDTNDCLYRIIAENGDILNPLLEEPDLFDEEGVTALFTSTIEHEGGSFVTLID